MKTVSEWKTALRDKLKEAMRLRNASLISLYRETLSAIDNAEAPAVSEGPAAGTGAIAGALVGLGAGDAPRLELTPEQVRGILERELAERHAGAASYESLGRVDEASALRTQAQVLADLLQ